MRRGEIYNATLDAPGSAPGREPIGYRPVLVISSEAYNNKNLLKVMIVPLTKTVKLETLPHTIRIEPTPENGLDETSILLVLDTRGLDTRRIKGKRGEVDQRTIDTILAMIGEMFSD